MYSYCLQFLQLRNVLQFIDRQAMLVFATAAAQTEKLNKYMYRAFGFYSIYFSFLALVWPFLIFHPTKYEPKPNACYTFHFHSNMHRIQVHGYFPLSHKFMFNAHVNAACCLCRCAWIERAEAKGYKNKHFPSTSRPFYRLCKQILEGKRIRRLKSQPLNPIFDSICVSVGVHVVVKCLECDVHSFQSTFIMNFICIDTAANLLCVSAQLECVCVQRKCVPLCIFYKYAFYLQACLCE